MNVEAPIEDLVVEGGEARDAEMAEEAPEEKWSVENKNKAWEMAHVQKAYMDQGFAYQRIAAMASLKGHKDMAKAAEEKAQEFFALGREQGEETGREYEAEEAQRLEGLMRMLDAIHLARMQAAEMEESQSFDVSQYVSFDKQAMINEGSHDPFYAVMRVLGLRATSLKHITKERSKPHDASDEEGDHVFESAFDDVFVRNVYRGSKILDAVVEVLTPEDVRKQNAEIRQALDRVLTEEWKKRREEESEETLRRHREGSIPPVTVVRQ